MTTYNRLQYVLLLVPVGLIFCVFYLLLSNRQSIIQYMREAHYRPLAIATNPSGATVNLDGTKIGITPITVSTYAGAHTVTVNKAGFTEKSIAIDLEDDRYERTEDRGSRVVHSAKPWIVNLELEPQSTLMLSMPAIFDPQDKNSVPPKSQGSERPSSDQQLIADEKFLIGRVDLIESRLGVVDQKIDLLSTLKLGILGTLVAVFFAFIAFLVGIWRRVP